MAKEWKISKLSATKTKSPYKFQSNCNRVNLMVLFFYMKWWYSLVENKLLPTQTGQASSYSQSNCNLSEPPIFRFKGK